MTYWDFVGNLLMINYDEMSDADINEKIATHFGVMEDRYGDVIFAAVKHAGENVNSVIGWVDYCNNPNDAWPIIFENKISLDPRKSLAKLPWMASVSDQVWATDKNPLRAAMICFLKMKDAENENHNN